MERAPGYGCASNSDSMHSSCWRVNAVRVRRAGRRGRGTDGAHGGCSALAVALAAATGDVLELPVSAARTIGVLPLPLLALEIHVSDALCEVALVSALDGTAAMMWLAEGSSRTRFSEVAASFCSDFCDGLSPPARKSLNYNTLLLYEYIKFFRKVTFLEIALDARIVDANERSHAALHCTGK